MLPGRRREGFKHGVPSRRRGIDIERWENLLDEPRQKDRKEMPFLGHLEELRWCILKALAAVIVGAVVCFVFSDQLLKLLTYPYEEAVRSLESERPPGAVDAVRKLLEEWMGSAPPGAESGISEPDQALPDSRRLQSLKPMTYFFISLQIALIGGLVLALPVVFYQVWRFVAPGLLSSEKRIALPLIGLSVLCFTAGALVAYWIVLPLGLRFFLALEPPDMTSQWAADTYIGFVLRLLVGFGLVFEMPVVALFLSRLGLLTPDYMRRIRRYAIAAIFVVAAIFTPPDPLSQILMALPVLLLYEISIWVVKVSRPRQETDEEVGED